MPLDPNGVAKPTGVAGVARSAVSRSESGQADHFCSVCRGPTQLSFRNQLLAKYDVAYYFCGQCGFLQTEKPYWLDEAYANAIADEDVDLVARNLRMMRILTCLLPAMFDRDATLLDLAGGYGLLTRLMRDNGLTFLWSDPYCTNLFAKEFSWQENGTQVTAVTAFEVLEHLEDPLAFIRDALDRTTSRTLIFTTQLFSGSPPEPGKWSYYASAAGQHISFYQARTFALIARMLSLHFYTRNGVHMLTRCRLRPRVLGLLSGRLSHVLYFANRFALDRRWTLPKLLRA